MFILPEGNKTTKNTQNNNITAAKATASIIFISEIIVTNCVLEEMNIEHPIGKLIIEIAKTQEKEIGDGTTTAVIIEVN